jgi:RNA polymerase sigma-70 factor (family 1)
VELTEKKHLYGLRSGDIIVFEMIFSTHYQPLCNYAFTFVRDKDEAEEIVQGAFLMVWEKRESIEIRTSLKSYLYTMVRNACLNVIKHQKVRQRHAARQFAVTDQSQDSVSNQVMAAELEERIQDAMESLPEQCRMVFKLSRFEELKYAEIADQLNISIKTVENHMGKALKIMRQQLKDYLPAIAVLMHYLFV